MSSVAGRLRVGLVTLGVAQLVWHGVFALVPGGGALGCAPSVGQAARAGVQPAWSSLPGGCAGGAAADARQLAITVRLAAAPLLAAHLLATVVGAGSWAWASRLGEMLADLTRLVVPRMPRRAVLSAERVLALPVPATAWSGNGRG